MKNIKRLEKIADILKKRISEKYGLPCIDIKIKNLIHGGRARFETSFISIPYWAYGRKSVQYFKYYVIHELCHFIVHRINSGADSHGELFKHYEGMILKEYKLTPVYKRAYVKQLKHANGQTYEGVN